MVQPAKDRMRNNASETLDRACAGCLLPQRNVSSHFIIIGGLLRKNSSQVLGVENNQTISTLVPVDPIKRSTYPFCQGERNEMGRSRITEAA